MVGVDTLTPTLLTAPGVVGLRSTGSPPVVGGIPGPALRTPDSGGSPVLGYVCDHVLSGGRMSILLDGETQDQFWDGEGAKKPLRIILTVFVHRDTRLPFRPIPGLSRGTGREPRLKQTPTSVTVEGVTTTTIPEGL